MAWWMIGVKAAAEAAKIAAKTAAKNVGAAAKAVVKNPAKAVAKGAVKGAKAVVKQTKPVKLVKAAKNIKKTVKGPGSVAGKAWSVYKDVKSVSGGSGQKAGTGGSEKEFATQGATTPQSSKSLVELIGQKTKGGNPLHYHTHKAQASKPKKRGK